MAEYSLSKISTKMISTSDAMHQNDSMTCTHTKADKPISRLVMLLSHDGLGCYECNSRLMLPTGMRFTCIGAMFLPAPMGVFGMPAGALAALVFAGVLFLTPWICSTPLIVVPNTEKEGA